MNEGICRGSMVAAAVAVWACVGCAGNTGEPPPSSGADGLTLTEATSTRVAGTYVDAIQRIDFEARAPSALETVIRIQLADKTLALHADYGTGRHDVDGGGATLEIADKDALRSLASHLSHTLGEDTSSLPLTAQTLLAVATYWSEAPTRYVHAPRTFQLAAIPAAGALRVQSFGDDGISCVRKGSWYAAYYNGYNGDAAEWVMANANWGTGPNGGDFACMGRCGSGCSGFSVFGRWTLDCLEHDVCSYRYGATTGPLDWNCGDEFNNAYDDFMNLGWYGCGG